VSVSAAEPSRGSDPIQTARLELAAAYRLAARFGFNEGIDNHFTLMVPGSSDRFLLNAFGLHWSEVTASNLIAIDFDGQVVEGGGEAEATAYFIHSRIHRVHARAECILHTHMPYATALTSIQGGRLEPVGINALRFNGAVAYDETYNGEALSIAEGDRMAALMGDARVLFLANHGVIVVGPSVAEAFDDLYFLEQACRVQALAMATGKPLRSVPSRFAEGRFGANPEAGRYARLHFAALLRLLDRDDPGYRN
jgi:ribulose-5-phosphate 4-epimerase/fuculose-1-phosphate aldolase